ncbi:MAG TPA: hypothetical protein VKA21_08925 [Candidatus Binatia bacterium]|nr:hypothetical protein [Candidatus Binatia bacterium]
MTDPAPLRGLFDDRPRPALRAGERQLLLAVLADAVESVLRCRHARDGEARRLYAETRAWFASRDRSALFSFEGICDALDLDPEYVRRMISDRTVRRRRYRPPALGARGGLRRAH